MNEDRALEREVERRLATVETEIDNLKDRCEDDRTTNSKFRHGFRGEMTALVGNVQFDVIKLVPRVTTLEEEQKEMRASIKSLQPESWKGSARTAVAVTGILGLGKAFLEFMTWLGKYLGN